MIQRYKIIDILNLTHLGNEDYCKSSDVKPLEKKVKQLEKDHAEELTIATLLGYDKAKDKIEKLEKQNKQLLDALKGVFKEQCNNTDCVGCLYQDDSCRYREIRELIISITGKKPEDYNVK